MTENTTKDEGETAPSPSAINVTLYPGDNIASLKTMKDNSVDSIVTDPPYGLSQHSPEDITNALTAWASGKEYLVKKKGFMGNSWDSFVPGPELWREAYRVLKPGGHVLCFAGSRTDDLMGIALRLGGFEIRDKIMWLYGTGFPKSVNIGKAIDKAGGVSPVEQAALLREKREKAGLSRSELAAKVECTESSIRDWEEGRARAAGKPLEFMVPSEGYRAKLADILGYTADERIKIGSALDRRGDGSVYGIGHTGDLTVGGNTDAAKQWDGWGTALKPAHEPIIVARKPLIGTVAANVLMHGTGGINVDGCRVAGGKDVPTSPRRAEQNETYGDLSKDPGTGSGWDPNVGRFPANVIHDGSDEVEEAFAAFGERPGQLGTTSTADTSKTNSIYGKMKHDPVEHAPRGDSGTASRFFYSAKATRADRANSKHPTVKPIALMEYLVRLVTPTGGIVLDPFAGSGTTGAAAVNEGFNIVLMEREAEYCSDIANRFAAISAKNALVEFKINTPPVANETATPPEADKAA